MDRIVQNITKAGDAFKNNRANHAFMEALKRAVDDAYELEERDRDAELNKQKNAALSGWFADAAAQLPTIVSEMASAQNDEEVKSDWRAIFGELDFNDYFYEVLERTAARHQVELQLVVNVPMRLEFGESIPCGGDECWYSSNPDRVRGVSFYKNLISGHVYCDMCIHEHDHADIPPAEVADDFIAYCKEKGLNRNAEK